jgi:hypothetical protein
MTERRNDDDDDDDNNNNNNNNNNTGWVGSLSPWHGASSVSGWRKRPRVMEIKTVSGKVKLSLCLTKHHAMKTYWGVEVKIHAFFDLGTRWR